MVRVNYLWVHVLLFFILLFFFCFVRFVTFRRVLDAEIKEATRMGATLKTNGEEKEDANNEEEEEEEKELFLSE